MERKSPYDRKAFMENFSGLESLAREAIIAFDALLPRMLSELGAAITSRDAQAVETSAHTLKGAVANFFAEPSRSLAAQLEDFGARGELSQADAVFVELKGELAELRRALLDSIRGESAA